jgi:membrane protease YdiL (CAAX protease family)
MAGYIDTTGSVSATAPGDLVSTVVYLGRSLLGSKLLLGYVVLGTASGLAGGGYGLAQAAANYLVLLPLYTLVIYLWTRGEPTLAEQARDEASGGRGRSLTRDLMVVGLLFGFNLAVTAWFWSGGLPAAVSGEAYRLVAGAGWDRELTHTVASGLTQTLFQLLPAALILFALFRLSPAQVALVPRRLGLGLALMGIGVAVAALLKWSLGISPTPLFKSLELVPLALAVYFAHMLVNGLPEEFIFRGGMLTRLLPWFRNPHHAILLVAVLFTAMHIPSQAAQPDGSPWWTLILASQPTGLIWGYLCYRTRSIWPGVLWHTSFMTLGVLFLG